MPHIFCLDGKCRTVIHLDSEDHWNFKGKIRCKRCGAEIEVEISEGEIKNQKLFKEGRL